MHERDFHDGLRDDADDVLVRHAYADWLDEQGRVGEGEFYRLCGDLIEAEPWSVEEELIEARLHFLFRTVLNPLWGERLESVPGAVWAQHAGLLHLKSTEGNDPPPLSRSVHEAAQELPIFHTDLSVPLTEADVPMPLSATWLRSVNLGLPAWEASAANFYRGWREKLRRIVAPVEGTAHIPLAELSDSASNLHCLEHEEPDWCAASPYLAGFRSLRELIAHRVTGREWESVLRSLPASLRTLTLKINGANEVDFGRGRQTVWDVPAVRTLTLEPNNRSQSSMSALGEFGRLPLFDTLEEFNIRCGLVNSFDDLPVRPPRLRRMCLRVENHTRGLRQFCDAWGTLLRSMVLTYRVGSFGREFAPLAESRNLRQLAIVSADGEPLVRALCGGQLAQGVERFGLCGGRTLSNFTREEWPSLRILRCSGSRDESEARLRHAFNTPLFEQLESFRMARSHITPGSLDVLLRRCSSKLRVLVLECGTLTTELLHRLRDSPIVAGLDQLELTCEYIPSVLHEAVEEWRAEQPQIIVEESS